MIENIPDLIVENIIYCMNQLIFTLQLWKLYSIQLSLPNYFILMVQNFRNRRRKKLLFIFPHSQRVKSLLALSPAGTILEVQQVKDYCLVQRKFSIQTLTSLSLVLGCFYRYIHLQESSPSHDVKAYLEEPEMKWILRSLLGRCFERLQMLQMFCHLCFELKSSTS